MDKQFVLNITLKFSQQQGFSLLGWSFLQIWVKGTFKRSLKSYLKELKGVKEYLQELMFEVLKELFTPHIFIQFYFLWWHQVLLG